MHAQALLCERFVGVVGAGHALARERVSTACYTAARHVLVARRSRSRGGQSERGIIDDCMATQGFAQDIATTVAGFWAAIAIAPASDLVASVPELLTGDLRGGLHTFSLPFEVPRLTISLPWHPRLHANAAHRWLRDCVREVCAAGLDDTDEMKS